jgi:NAD-dependent deacetylase
MNMMVDIERVISLIQKSNRIVVLSGAGISTEAGIPDFRSAGGLWQDSSLMQRLSASGFRQDPESYYRESVKLFSTIRDAKPTIAHRLLARLEELGKIEAVVTQNIDGLHNAAGSKKVYELHGSYHTGHCPGCGARFEMAGFYSQIESGELKAPRCSGCGIPIKPDIVLFEDPLPVDAWEGSVDAVSKSDLMLVLGSSLVVYPAAELPMIALSSGAQMAIINLEKTAYDRLATVVVRGKLGEFAQSTLAAFS